MIQKFKGIEAGTDKWVYGEGYERFIDESGKEQHIIADYNDCWITIEFDSFDKSIKTYHYKRYTIIPDTISKFINRTDKNGVDIYTNDIIENEDYGKFIVFCNNEKLRYDLKHINEDGTTKEDEVYHYLIANEHIYSKYFKVVGNIKDVKK